MDKINLDSILNSKEYPKSRVPIEYVTKRMKELGYVFSKENKDIALLVVWYFLRDPLFLESKLVKNGNSFGKGLIIYGTYGIGKSMLFETLHKIGKELILERGISDLWFVTCSAAAYVEDYMQHDGTRLGIKEMYKGKLYIDDLGFEKKVYNKTELLSDILFERNRAKTMTFVTTNLTPHEVFERYGQRIADRIPEMFNVIQWEGESLRKF